LYKLFNEPDIIKHTKSTDYAGLDIYMYENSRRVKKVFCTRPEGTRTIGRPKLRWEDGDPRHQGPGSEELEECGYG
jgi:hypothetical protein